MSVNRYAGRCVVCGEMVPALGGRLLSTSARRVPVHLACVDAGQPAVVSYRTSGGTFIRNARGRCEDAPCCGCCSY